MKVLQIHVRYTTTLTSGENSTIDRISGYLSDFAELETLIFSMPNRDFSILEKFRHLFFQFKAMSKLLKIGNFQLVFVHNQIPFLPSILLNYLSRRVRIVKVWHNQRPFCIKGSSYLNGSICNKCSKTKFKKLNSILNSCYRDNRWQTILAELNQLRIVSILKSDRIFHVTVSHFLQKKLIQEGFNPDRVFCIQNAVDEHTIECHNRKDFVFLGRICSEKGIDKLLDAWNFYRLNFPGSQKLHIIGDGPLFFKLKSEYADSQTIFYGHLNSKQIYEVTKRVKVGVIPNVWEEPFGKVALDFLNLGLRIVATRSGGLIEILSEDEATIFVDSISVIELSNKMLESSLIKEEIDFKKRRLLLKKFSDENIEMQWRDLVTKLMSEKASQ